MAPFEEILTEELLREAMADARRLFPDDFQGRLESAEALRRAVERPDDRDDGPRAPFGFDPEDDEPPTAPEADAALFGAIVGGKLDPGLAQLAQSARQLFTEAASDPQAHESCDTVVDRSDASMSEASPSPRAQAADSVEHPTARHDLGEIPVPPRSATVHLQGAAWEYHDRAHLRERPRRWRDTCPMTAGAIARLRAFSSPVRARIKTCTPDRFRRPSR
jgi:hypothetical protein